MQIFCGLPGWKSSIALHLVPSCNICHNYIKEEIACSLEKAQWCTKLLSGGPEHLNCMWVECLDFTCDKKRFFKVSGK